MPHGSNAQAPAAPPAGGSTSPAAPPAVETAVPSAWPASRSSAAEHPGNPSPLSRDRAGGSDEAHTPPLLGYQPYAPMTVAADWRRNVSHGDGRDCAGVGLMGAGPGGADTRTPEQRLDDALLECDRREK